MDGPANTVIPYTDANGRQPYTEWLNGLRDHEAKRRIAMRVKDMASGGFGGAKSVGGGVSEFRIHYGPGYRVYYGQQGKRIYLLLCGGDKSTQPRDIRQAKAYWQEHKRRK